MLRICSFVPRGIILEEIGLRQERLFKAEQHS